MVLQNILWYICQEVGVETTQMLKTKKDEVKQEWTNKQRPENGNQNRKAEMQLNTESLENTFSTKQHDREHKQSDKAEVKHRTIKDIYLWD